jgi:hypothetical protein
MELNEKQFQRIAGLLPVQRGNVKIQNRTLLLPKKIQHISKKV